jgi:hypothetical protein
MFQFVPGLIFIAVSFPTALAQTQNSVASTEAAASNEFRFVSTTKTATFEKELNDVAKQGYRFIRLAKSFNHSGLSGLAVRLQSAAAANEGAPKFEYKVLATNKLSTLQKELEAATAEGYEFLGITTQQKLLPFSFPETIAILERPTGESKRRFDCRFLATQREKTLQTEMDAAVSEGFHPAGMIFGEDVNAMKVIFGSGFNFHTMVVLSRDANNPAAGMGTHEYRFLKTTKVSTMEKEMAELAKQGFQFHLTSLGSITIMSRPHKATAPRYEYKLLATSRTGTMQKELMETGAQGYRFVGTSSGAGGLVSVLEHEVGETAKDRRFEYKFLATVRESTTQKELSEALAAGFKFLEVTSLGERLIVLGRMVEAK